MSEYNEILSLHQKLIISDFNFFPAKGTGIHVSNKHGVYLIFSPDDEILHVGTTKRGKKGLNQRLGNHRSGNSSFTIKFLNNQGHLLSAGYKFKYLEVKDPRKRALLEALTIGLLCPAHIGTGEKK